MKTVQIRVHPIDNHDNPSVPMNDCEVSTEGCQRGGVSFDMYLADDEIAEIKQNGSCPSLTDALGFADYRVEFEENGSTS